MTFRKIWPLAIVFLLLLVCMPRSSKPAFEYRKGQPWKYDSFIAPFDFPILKTQEQIQEELSRSSAPAIPYYRFSAEVENKGQFYLYPHLYPSHWVDQQYMPDDLLGTHYYVPGDNKLEQATKRYWDEIKK